MKKLISFTLVLFLNINIYGSDNTTWSGDGHIELNYSTHSTTIFCHEVNFKMERSENLLTWKTFLMKCINQTGGITELDYSGFEFIVLQKDIYYRGERIGKINKDEFSFRISYLGEETLFTLHGKQNQDSLELVMEEFFDVESSYFKYIFNLKK